MNDTHKVFFFLPLLLLLLACKTPRPTLDTSESNAVEISEADEPENKIVFLIFNITKSSENNGSEISNYQLYETAGLVKDNLAENPPAEDFIMGILERGTQTASDTFYVEHPLYRHVEFVNEQQQLERKFIELDESEFFVRIQKEEFVELRLYEFIATAKNKKLGSFRF